MQCKTGGKAGVVLADWPMTALPAGGWTFLHWTGDASGTNASVSLTMDRPKTVQAVFGTAVHTSTLGGAGAVRLDSERALYPYGASLRVTAVPGAGMRL